MSLWYDLKKKSYATNGKESWIKSYCDRAIGLLSQKLSAHFSGAEGRHNAEDLDFDQTSTVKEAITQGFEECSRKNESLVASLETEKAERLAECQGIRTELQDEKAERLADGQEIRDELQNEIQAIEGITDSIRADITPVLLTNELKEATLDETDSSVLCIDARGNYSAQGLEISFKAPCSKSEISRIDLTLSIDEDTIDLLSEEDIEIPDLDIPTEDIEEPEEPDIAVTEKTESFTLKNGKDFKEGEYVTILFSGTTAEVEEVYHTGFFDYRIVDNAKNISRLKRNLESTGEEVSENWADIMTLKDKTDALEDFRDSVEASSMKLIQKISLDESVASIQTTFEKPLKELYVRFIGKLDSEEEVSDCTLMALCDGGSQYFVYSGNKLFSPTMNKAFIFHSKEVLPNCWETDYPLSTLNATDAGVMQGINAHSSAVHRSYSTRYYTNLPRYVANLTFAILQGKYSFAVGSTLEIYGVEVDE